MKFQFIKLPLAVKRAATKTHCAIIVDSVGVSVCELEIDSTISLVDAKKAAREENELVNLFAASPDLLASLEQVIEWIDNWNPDFVHDPDWTECEKHLRSAIAKAYGKE